jgi:hypothetical protein
MSPMFKRCSQCQSDNLPEALRCHECGHEFPPQVSSPLPVIGPATEEFAPPPVAAPSSPSRPVPATVATRVTDGRVAELQGEVQRSAQEIMDARALVAQLEKVAADRQGEVQALKARVERQQNDLIARHRAAAAIPVVPVAAVAQPWMSRALVALSKWPRVMMAVGGIAVVAMSLGGWTLSRSRPARLLPIALPVGETPTPVPPIPAPGPPDQLAVQPSQDAIIIDANLREQKRLDALKGTLDTRQSAMKTREAGVNTLAIDVNRREAFLNQREVGLNNRDTSLKAREAGFLAQSRVQPKAEPPRTGYFDFMVTEKKDENYFTIAKGNIQGDGSSWPSRECMVVAVSPLDGDDRPAAIASTCTPERIVITKLKGLKKNHTARLIWQLK